MALIIKSDVSYEGKAHLTSVADITKTAQEFYAEYEAWVLADGGEIINPGACLDAITWAKGMGVLGKSKAVGANFGMKRTGDGKITKLYGLDGSVFTPSGFLSTLDTTSNDFPAIQLGGAHFYSNTQRSINSTKFSIGVSAHKINTIFYSSFGVGQLPGVVVPLGYPCVNIYNVGSNENFSGMGTSLINTANTRKFKGMVGYYDELSISAAVDGIILPSTAQANNTTARDLRESQMLIGTRRLANGTNYSEIINSLFTEFWLINDSSIEIAQSLSRRLGDLYSTAF